MKTVNCLTGKNPHSYTKSCINVVFRDIEIEHSTRLLLVIYVAHRLFS